MIISPELPKCFKNRHLNMLCFTIRSNNNVWEVEREYVLIQFLLSFNNTKLVELFTLLQSQSLEGIFLRERLPWCDTWAMLRGCVSVIRQANLQAPQESCRFSSKLTTTGHFHTVSLCFCSLLPSPSLKPQHFRS